MGGGVLTFQAAKIGELDLKTKKCMCATINPYRSLLFLSTLLIHLHHMERLISISKDEDIPSQFSNTPIGNLLA